jgi:hypothetical protein
MPWISVPFGVSDPKHSCIFPSFDMPPICWQTSCQMYYTFIELVRV